MSSRLELLGIDRLPLEERLSLVEEIWDNIASQPQQVPLTEPQMRELERRLAAYEADPGNVIPWEQIRADAIARFRQ